MITHVWSVLCLQSIINEHTKNISLIEVLEQLTITGPPLPEGQEGAVPITFDVVSLWTREPDSQPARGSARLSLLSPTNSVIKGDVEYAVDLPDPVLRTRTVTRITGLPFRRAGIYHFRIQLREEGEAEWRDVAIIPLQIVIQPLERPTPS